MTRSLLRISVVAMATFALSVMTAPAHAQSTEELLKQLCGKAEAPARDAAQLAQAYQKAVDHLLPLMSAEDVGSRYALSDHAPGHGLARRPSRCGDWSGRHWPRS